jgi:hypothetical protein
MAESDWIKINLFACAVQCFHHGGLLPFFAIYLHNEKGIKYTDFYADFIKFIYSDKNSLLYKVFSEIENRLNEVINKNRELTFVDERFGDVVWPIEEYAFLNFVYDIDTFYEETEAFLRKYIENEFFGQLLSFQKMMLKQQIVKINKSAFDYNFFEYFLAVYKNGYTGQVPLPLSPSTENIPSNPHWYKTPTANDILRLKTYCRLLLPTSAQRTAKPFPLPRLFFQKTSFPCLLSFKISLYAHIQA